MPEKKNEDSNKTIKESDVGLGAAQAARAKAEPDIERTIAAAPPRKAEEIRAAEAEVALEWNIGDVILDLYEVKDIHKGGGMGLVYRVRHRGWDINLAVKSPRADFFRTEEQKENFVRECETWINLGLYPHTVSCYYVRTLGGMPRVFAEYVEGGSLSEWIKTGKLYEGGKDKALERILDIAIQFAWGLHYAHEQGLIHQDVKPANVMMTPDGTPKVTDFGLAKARGLAGEGAEVAPDRSVLVSTGGMTPAYCSPEQAAKQPLSRKTDIWSWGLSVLEMFTGEVTWMAGQAAAEVLESYIETGAEDEVIPKMPEAAVELLKRCFQREPNDRPGDMQEIITRTKEAYLKSTGGEHSRPEPKAAELLADALNNRAVSLLDLGRFNETENLLAQALETQPDHIEASYNQGLFLWRSGRITDIDLVRKLEGIRPSHIDSWADEFFLGCIHAERGDAQAAVRVFEEAVEKAPGVKDLELTLDDARRHTCDWRQRLQTYEGHESIISTVMLSPDGRLGFSGDWDGKLRFWDLSSGRCLKVLEEEKGAISCFHLDKNGRYIITGSGVRTAVPSDYQVRVWDLKNDECIASIGDFSGSVISLCQINKVLFVAAERSSHISVWYLSPLSHLYNLEGYNGLVTGIDVRQDLSLAVSGGEDATVRLWDIKDFRSKKKSLKTLQGHTEHVQTVAFVGDGATVLSGGKDWTLRLWRVDSGECIKVLKGHRGEVQSVSVSEDGQWALSGSKDRTVRLWHLGSGQCVRTFAEAESADLGYSPRSVAISKDGRKGFWPGIFFSLGLWELQDTGQPAPVAVAVPRTSSELLQNARLVRDATIRARSALAEQRFGDALEELDRARHTPGYERFPELLDLWRHTGLNCRLKGFRGAWRERVIDNGREELRDCQINRSGSRAISSVGEISCMRKGTIKLFDLSTGNMLKSVDTDFKYLADSHRLSVSADERFIFYGASSEIRLINLENCATLWARDLGLRSKVQATCISPNGEWVASGNEDNTIRVWSADEGQPLQVLRGHKGVPTCLAVKLDGRLLLSGSADRTARAWCLVRGRCIHKLRGHIDEVMCVAICPQGKRALTGSGDQIRYWDLTTGQCLKMLQTHHGRVTATVIAPFGRWAFTGGEDSKVRLWDLDSSSSAEVWSFEGHTKTVVSLGISSDGRRLISASWDKTICVWELDWDYEFPGFSDCAEPVSSFLEAFLAIRANRSSSLKGGSRPTWTENEFEILLYDLRASGFGWLRPEGVRKQLDEMARKWESKSTSTSILSKLFGRKH